MREFNSFEGLANHLDMLNLILPEAIHHAADIGGELVEIAAKAEIGQYQPAVGPFEAWSPLADGTEEDKAKHGYPLNAPLLRTGEMQNSISRTTCLLYTSDAADE